MNKCRLICVNFIILVYFIFNLQKHRGGGHDTKAQYIVIWMVKKPLGHSHTFTCYMAQMSILRYPVNADVLFLLIIQYHKDIEVRSPLLPQLPGLISNLTITFNTIPSTLGTSVLSKSSAVVPATNYNKLLGWELEQPQGLQSSLMVGIECLSLVCFPK